MSILQDQSTVKAKASAISAVMKNPKLAKIMSEAWGAPPGSTISDKARSVLSSVHRTNLGYSPVEDGRGENILDTLGQGEVVSTSSPTAKPLAQDLTQATGSPAIQGASTTPVVEPRVGDTRIATSVDEIIPADSDILGPHKTYQAPTGYKQWGKRAMDWMAKTEKETIPFKYGAKIGNLWDKGVSWLDNWFDESNEDFLKARENKEFKSNWDRLLSNTVHYTSYANPIEWFVDFLGWKEGTADPWVEKKGWQAANIMQKFPGAFMDYMSSDPYDDEAWDKIWEKYPDLKAVVDFSEKSKENQVNATAKAKEQAETGEKKVWTQEGADGLMLTYMDVMDGRSDASELPEEWGYERLTWDAAIAKVEEITGFKPSLGKKAPIEDIGDKTPGDIENLGKVMGLPAVEAWYDGLDPSAKSLYKEAYEAVMAGKDIKGLYQDVWGDRALLEELGLPPELAAMWPKSGLLNEFLIDLKKMKRDEYGIDAMENKLHEMEMSGPTIVEDLREYVRSRDTGLADIEKLQKEFRKKKLDMDLSNPWVAKRVENYENYLGLLHARRNKRYVDYIDKSHTEWQARQTRLQAKYEFAFKKADEDYKEMAALSTESYNDIKARLDETFAMVDAQKDDFNNMSALGQVKYSSLLDISNKELTNVYKGLQNIYYDQDKNAANLSLSDVSKLWFTNINKDTGQVDGLGVLNPWRAINLAVAAKAATAGVAQTHYMDTLGSYIKGIIAKGGIDTTLANIYGDLKRNFQYMTMSDTELKEFGYNDEQIAEINNQAANVGDVAGVYNAAVDKLRLNINFGLKERLIGQGDTIKKIKDAIDDLDGSILGIGMEKDRSKFVSKWGAGDDGIGTDIAGILYDRFWRSYDANKSTKPGDVLSINVGENEKRRLTDIGDQEWFITALAGFAIDEILK